MNDFLSFGSAVATNYGVTFIFQTNLNFHEKPQFYVTSSQLTSQPEFSPAKVLTYKSRGELTPGGLEKVVDPGSGPRGPQPRF